MPAAVAMIERRLNRTAPGENWGEIWDTGLSDISPAGPQSRDVGATWRGV